MSRRVERSMRVLLIVLTVALALLVSDPVQAQTAANDQYGPSGVGYDAATDAVRASNAFGGAPATEAADVEEGAAFAAGTVSASSDPEAVSAEAASAEAASAEAASAEAASADESGETEAAASEGGAGSEEGLEIDSLPTTGGTPPLLLGVLLVASGVLSLRALTR